MTTSVISAFEDKVARKVMSELQAAGVQSRDIEVLEGREDEIVAKIIRRGFDEKEARGLAAAGSRGKTLVVARVPDEQVDRAATIMDRYEASQGESRFDREEKVPVIEEELSVGKRQVAAGGVRVTTTISETPVEETVKLREEEVEVDRQAVDRKASADELDGAFEEKTLEMVETSEELEVGKEARVVEEVSLGKKVKEREETVRDKVRRTDVEVERLEPSSRKGR